LHEYFHCYVFSLLHILCTLHVAQSAAHDGGENKRDDDSHARINWPVGRPYAPLSGGYGSSFKNSGTAENTTICDTVTSLL